MAALNDKDANANWGVYTALGEIGAPAVDPLVELLKSPESMNSDGTTSPLRKGAFYALREIGSPAVEPLIADLKDKDVDVRKEAALSLGEIKDPRAVQPLIAILMDPDAGVRRVALGALGPIGQPAVDPLIAILKDPDDNLRRVAAQALGGIRDSRAVDALMAALRGRDYAVIAGAPIFFVERGEPASEEILIDTLKKSDDEMVASTFLNCGNAKLEKAARKWKKRRGETLQRTIYVEWGSARQSPAPVPNK